MTDFRFTQPERICPEIKRAVDTVRNSGMDREDRNAVCGVLLEARKTISTLRNCVAEREFILKNGKHRHNRTQD